MKSYKSYKKLRTSYEKVTKSYEKLQKVTNELRGLIFRASFPKSWKNGLPIRAPRQPKTKKASSGKWPFKKLSKPILSKKCTFCKGHGIAPQKAGLISFGSYVATFGPHLKEKGWSHLDPIGGHLRPHNKKQGCCHLPPMLRSWARTPPHPFTPISLTAVLWGLTHQTGGTSPHWDVNVAYSVNGSPDSKIPARPARRHQHPCYWEGRWVSKAIAPPLPNNTAPACNSHCGGAHRLTPIAHRRRDSHPPCQSNGMETQRINRTSNTPTPSHRI